MPPAASVSQPEVPTRELRPADARAHIGTGEMGHWTGRGVPPYRSLRRSGVKEVGQ
jgi:hypothetical protein